MTWSHRKWPQPASPKWRSCLSFHERDERTIQRDVRRGEELGSQLDEFKGTSLDKPTELDALAKITPESACAPKFFQIFILKDIVC